MQQQRDTVNNGRKAEQNSQVFFAHRTVELVTIAYKCAEFTVYV